MKILVAEDSVVSRRMLSAALETLGHEVVAVADGQAAWEELEKETFPVVITDWQMPCLDGPELCRRLRGRSQPRYTYVLMLTALDSKTDYISALEAGADDFLIKPFDVQVLTARLLVAQRISGLLTEARRMAAHLPICFSCKKIRGEDNQWLRVEQYMAAQAKVSISHSLCPGCQSNRSQLTEKLRRDFRAQG